MAYFISPLLIDLLDTTAQIQALCKEVALVFALFMPAISLHFALDNYLRICGKNAHAMIVNIIVAFSNVILDYLFTLCLTGVYFRLHWL